MPDSHERPPGGAVPEEAAPDAGVPDGAVPDGAVPDEGVPRYWRELGLPGLVDAHVHFHPERVTAKIWAYFDAAGEPPGLDWTIRYREPEGVRLARLRAMGVRAFPSLVYPHKPGMARWLNDWAGGFAERTPGCVRSATFYPEPGVADYVAAALSAGARIMKVHVQVGDYDPRDRLLDPVWGMLADAGVPVVTHSGSGPLPGRFTGPHVIGEVLRRHPALHLVFAHCGLPEYDEHLALAEAYPNVRVDTTMVGTDFVAAFAPLPAAATARLRDLRDKVVLGTDYPMLPYPYVRQVEALVRLDLGDDWLRAVLWENGARLFGIAT